MRCGPAALAVKRALDVALSLIALVVLIVPFAVIALAVKAESRGPALFRQERIGRGERPFRVWKFRTMVIDAESHPLGARTPQGDPRITHVGRWLRRLGIDELPQLLNVLHGAMSLVGPRPTLAYQVAKYDRRQKRRLLVKPGITGWALINGRNRLTWPEKIELDVWYADHWSIPLDLYILLRTPIVVLSGQGLFIEESDEILGNGEV